MASFVYIVGAVTALACAALLLRGYARAKQRLLLWSGLCFVGLAISNVLVFLDLVILPQVNLYKLRLATVMVALAVLLYGLIWESD